MAVMSSVEVQADTATNAKTVTTTIDVMKLVALTVFGLLLFVLAFVLFVTDRDAGAATFASLGSAVLAGGFGIAVGEKTGAKDAETKLT
jgi:hypothetical protein